MSITTYTELKSALANWTHRADLTSRIPEFITLAEARIFYGSEDPEMPSEALRITAMENRDTGTASSGAIAYPTGYLETIRLVITTNGKNRALRYRSPVDLAAFETSQGNAQYFTQVNGSIYVGPPTCPYTHDYYKILTALSDSNATNWLLTNAPNVYLYGAMVEAMPFMGKDARIAMWYRMFVAALKGLQKSDNKSTMGGTGLAVMPG